MPLLRLVIDGRAPLHDIGEARRIEDLVGPRRTPDLLGQRERGAAIPIGHAHEGEARLCIQRQGPALDHLSPRQQLRDGGLAEGAEGEHARPRQQSGVEFKRGVLGRGADERHGAVLHHRQERILLGAIETMDLVHKEQSALP